MLLIFDTETTGLSKHRQASFRELENWPRIVQLAWQTHANNGDLHDKESFIIMPAGFRIEGEACAIHGITHEQALADGEDLLYVLDVFFKALERCTSLVGHNVTNFDLPILKAEYVRCWPSKSLDNIIEKIEEKKIFDTMRDSAVLQFFSAQGPQISGQNGDCSTPNRTRFLKLKALYSALFGVEPVGLHNAAVDVDITAKCFWRMRDLGIFPQ